ncbi:MAG TPA: hypothetical protein VM470_07755, partial [Acidimicrobiia bacterium]|nr:hypothetical protein [Acidimicrobiia bacterium]
AAISLCGVVSRFASWYRRAAYTVFALALFGVAFDFGFERAVLLLSVAAVAAVVAARRAVALASLVGILFVSAALTTEDELLIQRRTFFGVSRVLSDGTNHTLVSGTTVHGAQRFHPTPSPQPLAYYHPAGPFGQTMEEFGTDAETIGVIGLGAGAMASLGQSGQTIYFYEIDPAVVEIASDPKLFTFLSNSAAQVEIVLGDGRLTIIEPHPPFDLMIVDAFSSDSIPTHLLTQQAISLYFEQLEAGSVVGLHISNRHLDLEPVIGRLAAEMGLQSRINRYLPHPDVIDAAPTTFVVLGRQLRDLGSLASDPDWHELRVGPHLWTDTYTDLISVIRWR